MIISRRGSPDGERSAPPGRGGLASGSLIGTAAILAVATVGPYGAAGASTAVSDTQQVSSTTPFSCSEASSTYRNMASEPTLAVSATHPRRQVTAWIQDQAAGIVSAHTSDGGRSWQRVTVPGLSACSGAQSGYTTAYDPWLSIGHDETIYLGSAANSAPLATTGQSNPIDGSVQVSVSRDRGAHWRPPVVIARDTNDGFIIDKPTVTADPRRAGTVYATWTRIAALGNSTLIGFARSTDHGAHWSTGTAAIAPPGSVYFGSQILALPDGSLVMILDQSLAQPLAIARQFIGDTTIVSLRSYDQGRSWVGPVQVAQADGAVAPYSAAVDSHGRMAVGYIHAGALGLARTDLGRPRWTNTTVVAAQNHPFLPTIAMSQGTVALLYDDHRSKAAAGQALTDVWLTHIRPSGSVSETHVAGPFDMASAPKDNGAGGDPLGDYQGGAAAGRGFSFAFAQDRPAAKPGPTAIFVTQVAPHP